MVQCALQLQRRGPIIDSIVFCQEEGIYSADIPKGVWHKLESPERNSVMFECEEGALIAA